VRSDVRCNVRCDVRSDVTALPDVPYVIELAHRTLALVVFYKLGVAISRAPLRHVGRGGEWTCSRALLRHVDRGGEWTCSRARGCGMHLRLAPIDPMPADGI
jgi:hypothetical protein